MSAATPLPRYEEASPSAPPALSEPPLRRRLPRRWGVWLLALLVVAAGATWLLRRQPTDVAPSYETQPVGRRLIESRVTATGTLSALVTVEVGSQVSGRIQELMVDYNSTVKKGQVIARIDPQLYEAAVARAKANVMAAKANVHRARVDAETARKQAERSRVLSDKQLIAQAETETAEASAESAQAAVASAEGALAQAQATLSEAQVNLRYTTIVSPTDGIVISRSVDVGQTVAASLQAPTLFTIAEDLRKMQVNTSVPEADVGRLEPGMPAAFTVDAYPGERFEGVIRQIRNAPQTVQNVVTYDAVIDVENPELKLKPGMTANVTLTTARKEDALAVPNAALRFKPPTPAPEQVQAASATGGSGGQPRATDGSRTLYVLRDGSPTPVRVRLGVTDGSVTEVVSGELREGDQAITSQAGSAGATASTTGARPSAGGPPPMGRGPF
ncbi:efflux RND transporter periplasmic adaptor subunit [Hyalangium rubrum]|uniref:Efflux RND transporter periplasmic adaptor subunit n=1 Tax=Hyalangium rubrum TaxID=3103134 RepID=A0ABU5HI20_9BACT|nr:efflux RND transporter periplasmic adaptor subunit [Hyalangium sp. s54d21]MDY7233123.1 efflux RND transporter periplasmic adaptor subunit [Hyalangium sp. s54d21]